LCTTAGVGPIKRAVQSIESPGLLGSCLDPDDLWLRKPGRITSFTSFAARLHRMHARPSTRASSIGGVDALPREGGSDRASNLDSCYPFGS
jgi:hypothetical protein